MRRSPLPILLGLAAACGEAPGPPTPEPVRGALQIGGAASEGLGGFIALEDGQPVELMPGAQGGFHVFLHVRVEAQSVPEEPKLYLDRSARREDTNQLVSQSKQRLTFAPSSVEGWYETQAAVPMFLCPAPAEIGIRDRVLVVRIAALALSAGVDVLAEETIRIEPRCPEGSQRELCERICSG